MIVYRRKQHRLQKTFETRPSSEKRIPNKIYQSKAYRWNASICRTASPNLQRFPYG
jgi:hypothetical protein